MEGLVRTATFAGMTSYIRVPDPHNATDVRRGNEAHIGLGVAFHHEKSDHFGSSLISNLHAAS
jgi:hypothetical protein